jgi:histidinol dehydrogenase
MTATILNRLDLRGRTDLAPLLPRPDGGGDEPVAAVEAILADVRERGDAAVLAYTEQFDGVVLDQLRVPQEQLDQAFAGAAPELVEALTAARDSIQAFHETQLRTDHTYERDGIVVGGGPQPGHPARG